MNPRSFISIGAGLLLILSSSCRLLNTEPLTITAYVPAAQLVDSASLDAVSVTFSSLPDRTLAEMAFSLTADGITEKGVFSWLGSTLEFRPFAGWKTGTDYELKVDGSVEDSDGHSLDRDFARSFSTRTERDRPEITGSTPLDGEALAALRPSITISFSEPMNPGSVADALRLSPGAEAYLDWNGTSDVFNYILLEDLDWQTLYTLSISMDAVDLQNNSLAEEWESSFFTGFESVNPSLISLSDPGGLVTGLPDDLGDAVLTITSGWETDQALVLSFSEPMDPESLAGSISIEPDVPWYEEWNGSAEQLTLTPRSNLDWGETFAIRIGTGLKDRYGNSLDEEYRYNIRVDGTASRPPELLAAVLYIDPGNAGSAFILAPYEGTSLSNFSPPPLSVAAGNTVLDFFFNIADGALPDIYSLAENLLVTVGGVNDFIPLAAALEDADFHPSNIATGPFGPADPGIPYDSWVRFIVYIDNNDSLDTGILTLKVSGDFTDNGGRSMGEDWVVPFQVTD
ncbi:MAG: Ig-like domain-containing protein [Spirochaetaceae bacterium]|nr:Ig-like domain-containing protein [Spirochaetaceae bacterium]